MPEIKAMYQRQRKYIFLLLSVYVLGWGFTDYKAVFLGLIFGTSLSLFNLWLMVRKAEKFENAVLQGKKVRSLGTFSRFATAAFAVIVVLEYPDDLHLISTVLGLMTSYFVIMIDYFKQSFHLRN
jgi:ATP synthase protein I